MSKKIYALLVGITEYNETIALDNGQVIFPQLAGCINDVNKVKKFLESNYKEDARIRSEEHTSELQSLMRISYAVFCLKKKNTKKTLKKSAIHRITLTNK